MTMDYFSVYKHINKISIFRKSNQILIFCLGDINYIIININFLNCHLKTLTYLINIKEMFQTRHWNIEYL